MPNCLLTTLPASVTDSTLPKLGELRIYFSKVSTTNTFGHSVLLTSNQTQTVTVVGGYFTDSTLTTNKGSSAKLPNGTQTTLYVSNHDGYISIPDKYALTYVNVASDMAKSHRFTVDLHDLSASTNIHYLHAYPATGDIADLKNLTGLIQLTLGGNSSPRLGGNISVVSNFPNLQELSLRDAFTGDLSSLGNPTKLTTVSFSESSEITGDIGVFRNCANLVTLYLRNIPGLYGDLAALPPNTIMVSCPNGGSFSWSSERPTTSKIISLVGAVRLSGNMDTMLINQSKCVPGGFSKDIDVQGSARTSASDSAVETLKSNGYTVTINGVKQ